MPSLRRPAIALGLAACVAGCGAPPPSPGAVAESYVTAVAEGSYGDACALLDAHARRLLQAQMRSAGGCAGLLARCLPTRSTVLRHDQTQLLYSDVAVRIDGRRATVRTSGTAVARRIRQVTAAKERGRWILTSYGRERCPTPRRARHRR